MEDCAIGDDEFDIAAVENAFRICNQERLLLGSYLRSSVSKPLPFYPEPDIKKAIGITSEKKAALASRRLHTRKKVAVCVL